MNKMIAVIILGLVIQANAQDEKIICIFNPKVETSASVTDTNKLSSTELILQLGVTTEGKVFTAKSFQQGWQVLNGTNVISEGVWPPKGVTLVSTDQDILHTIHIPWKPDWKITVKMWTIQDGKKTTTKRTFIVPRPPKPYLSWIWENGGWASPVPYPADGKYYTWNEKDQVWVLVEAKTVIP